MSGIVSRLKHELLEAIPPAIFFFLAFQLIAFTQALMLEEYGVSVSSFLKATVAALIVAKVIFVVDLMPLINRFPEKPLVYNVAWKTEMPSPSDEIPERDSPPGSFSPRCLTRLRLRLTTQAGGVRRAVPSCAWHSSHRSGSLLYRDCSK